MKFTKETQIGFFAIVALVMFYVGGNFLKGKDLFSSKDRYYTVYDRAPGILASTPVMLSGIQVGRVIKVELLPEEDYKTKVIFEVDKKLKIPLTTTSMAALKDQSLLGGKLVDLILSKEGEPLKPHDKIHGSVDRNITDAFMESTLPVINNIKNTSRLINDFTHALLENQHKINAAFNNLEQSTAAVREIITGNQENFNITSSSVAKVVKAISDEKRGVVPLLQNLNSLAEKTDALELIKGVNAFNRILVDIEKLVSKLGAEGGFVGKLLHEDKLYDNLNDSIKQVKLLSEDLRKNPFRYVNISIFGRRHRGQFRKSQKKDRKEVQ